MKYFDYTFHCPDIKSQMDDIEVEEALDNVYSIAEREVDHVRHTVFVRLSTPDGIEQVAQALIDAGYPSTESYTGRVSSA